MKIIKIILLVVCIFIFLFCLYNFIIVFEEKKESQNIKEQLIEISQVSPLEQTNEEETLNLINFTELKKVNSDIVGWITIDGTQVNYPIVQGKDNSYYLNHSSNKSYNSLGSIFMDYNSNKDFKDFNTFIYGHNTKNGSMFGEIKKYMDFNFYKKHPFFFLYTPSQNYKVEIFSVYVDEATSNSYNQSFIT
ncbi:MAG: class B sortase, partial [Methanobrevibacter sp.]|nr:class B sortase [Methanobrevibacter sp.]